MGCSVGDDPALRSQVSGAVPEVVGHGRDSINYDLIKLGPVLIDALHVGHQSRRQCEYLQPLSWLGAVLPDCTVLGAALREAAAACACAAAAAASAGGARCCVRALARGARGGGGWRLERHASDFPLASGGRGAGKGRVWLDGGREVRACPRMVGLVAVLAPVDSVEDHGDQVEKRENHRHKVGGGPDLGTEQLSLRADVAEKGAHYLRAEERERVPQHLREFEVAQGVDGEADGLYIQ